MREMLLTYENHKIPKRWQIRRPIEEIKKEIIAEDLVEGNPQKKARIKKPNRNPPVGPAKNASEPPNPAKTGSA